MFAGVDMKHITHGKYSLDVLRKAARRKYDSVNYLIKVRNQTFQSPSIKNHFYTTQRFLSTTCSSNYKRNPTSSHTKRAYQSQQKKFFQSKRLMFKIKERQKLQTIATDLINNETGKKSDCEGRLHGIIEFMDKLFATCSEFKDYVTGESLDAGLRSICKLVEQNSSFSHICANLWLFLGILNFRMFHLKECERNLLFAQFLARICQLYKLTLDALQQLIRLYLKQSRIEQAIAKTLSMLYIAVKEDILDIQSHSLSILSICYFYEGNIAKSSFYYNKSLTGVDEEERTSIKMSFDNSVNIGILEKKISGDTSKNNLSHHFNVEREPYDNEKVESFEHLNKPEERSWPLHFKKLINQHPVKKIGHRMVICRRGIHKNSMGHNTSQIYKTHRSANREWQNFVLQPTPSVGETFLLPNDNTMRKSFDKQVRELLLFAETIKAKASQRIQRLC